MGKKNTKRIEHLEARRLQHREWMNKASDRLRTLENLTAGLKHDVPDDDPLMVWKRVRELEQHVREFEREFERRDRSIEFNGRIEALEKWRDAHAILGDEVRRIAEAVDEGHSHKSIITMGEKVFELEKRVERIDEVQNRIAWDAHKHPDGVDLGPEITFERTEEREAAHGYAAEVDFLNDRMKVLEQGSITTGEKVFELKQVVARYQNRTEVIEDRLEHLERVDGVPPPNIEGRVKALETRVTNLGGQSSAHYGKARELAERIGGLEKRAAGADGDAATGQMDASDLETDTVVLLERLERADERAASQGKRIKWLEDHLEDVVRLNSKLIDTCSNLKERTERERAVADEKFRAIDDILKLLRADLSEGLELDRAGQAHRRPHEPPGEGSPDA